MKKLTLGEQVREVVAIRNNSSEYEYKENASLRAMLNKDKEKSDE